MAASIHHKKTIQYPQTIIHWEIEIPAKTVKWKKKIKVIYVHADYFASNMYKEIFEETDTNTTKVKSNGNVGNDM